jgi:hypothetical protein
MFSALRTEFRLYNKIWGTVQDCCIIVLVLCGIGLLLMVLAMVISHFMVTSAVPSLKAACESGKTLSMVLAQFAIGAAAVVYGLLIKEGVDFLRITHGVQDLKDKGLLKFNEVFPELVAQNVWKRKLPWLSLRPKK